MPARWRSPPAPTATPAAMRAIRASPSAPASSAISPASPARSCWRWCRSASATKSVLRLFQPVAIHYGEAVAIAVVGLAVNLLSARLLWDDHHHDHHHHAHGHDDDHDHGHHHHHDHDHNLRAAYWHVLADALTSVLAIAGLLAAWAYGWTWLDPAIGVVGALVIAHWSWGLIRASGAVLLDAAPERGARAGDPRRGWRGTTTASPTCMSGGWAPAITARSSRWCRTSRRPSRPTRRGWTTSPRSAMSPSRCIAARACTDSTAR